MALPKLDMGSVKDSEEREKTTLRESMRKLSRKASASLRRGLTPRGSRHERKDSFDSLDDAADDALSGALGPQSSQGSESLPPQSQPLSQPPLVEPPRVEHARLPQFEPAESAFNAAKEEASEEGGKQGLPAPADVAPLASSASTQDIPPSKPAPQPAGDTDRAPGPAPSKLQGDPAPHMEAPPRGRPDLPQFEDVSDAAAVTAAKATAWEPVPAGAAAAEPTGDAQEEAEAMVQDPPSAPRQGRPKWQEVALAVSIFAVGIIGAEPAINAWRRRRQPQSPPIVDAKAAKQKGGWGFS